MLHQSSCFPIASRGNFCIRPQDPGPYIAAGEGGGVGGAAAPARKTQLFSNIVFDFAELFPVAILVRNHKKIDQLTGNQEP